jgi:hypothetical protein
MQLVFLIGGKKSPVVLVFGHSVLHKQGVDHFDRVDPLFLMEETMKASSFGRPTRGRPLLRALLSKD